MTAFSAFPPFYWAQQQPARTAIIWQKAENDPLPFPEEISWQQLATHIANFSQNLPACSQIIGYVGTHKLLGLLSYCAVIAAGKQILGINPSFTHAQREQILSDNAVDLLLTDEEVLGYLRLSSPSIAQLHRPFHLNKPATLTLTSGSSGKPKAVVHSVQNHLENAQGVCELMDFSADDCWLLSLPLFHVSGQGIIWRWLLQGATLLICEDKNRFYHALRQASHASLVPTQLQRYLQNMPESAPLDQHILLGGAHIPEKLITEAQAHGITPYAGYGMTEMASTICAAKRALNHVGEPLAGREVCIAQDEIWVRGAGLGLGYWLNHQIEPLVNAEGWLATKDKGEWLGKNLRITGRLDNMFISGGENIQPEEIEQTLYHSGLIKAVFVLPKEDAEFGQRPIAFVDFIRAFSPQAVEELQNFAKMHLARFKQPLAYYPLDTEKWQQSGIKISRQQLKNSMHTFFCENSDEIN